MMKPIHSFLLSLLLVFLATSCTKKIYLPTEVIRTDSVSVVSDTDRQQFHSLLERLEQRTNIRDSVIIRDSVVMVINEMGDVVSKEKFRDRDHTTATDKTLELVQAKYDSIIQAQRNDFKCILEEMQKIPVPVEREFTKWEKFKLDCGGILLGLVAGILSIAVWWLIKKFRK